MEFIDLIPHLHGVAGIIATLGTDHYIGLGGENVDDLSLALVSPLQSHYHICWHFHNPISNYSGNLSNMPRQSLLRLFALP